MADFYLVPQGHMTLTSNVWSSISSKSMMGAVISTATPKSVALIKQLPLNSGTTMGKENIMNGYPES